ncbi:MAG TPA: hypothetical protein DEB06_01820 [Phycisphaerales bacterium]|nr:hypothetical protein [Phycisphaerales bacterium]
MKAKSSGTVMTDLARAGVSLLVSIVLGGVFGVAAAAGMGIQYMADFAFSFGAVTGLLCSPALIFGLLYGPWLRGLLWISAPTAVAAFVGGYLTPANSRSVLGLAMPISVFVLASLLRGVIGWKYHRRARLDACFRCGYPTAGLPPDTVCPECGIAAGDGQSMSAPTGLTLK